VEHTATGMAGSGDADPGGRSGMVTNPVMVCVG